MTQFETNMSTDSYNAYCNAWCVSFYAQPVGLELMIVDRMMADEAVRAGVVFG